MIETANITQDPRARYPIVIHAGQLNHRTVTPTLFATICVEILSGAGF